MNYTYYAIFCVLFLAACLPFPMMIAYSRNEWAKFAVFVGSLLLGVLANYFFILALTRG